MDKELEEIIVKAFFTKRIQQRVLFEFFSEKKRMDAMNRLNHNYSNTLRKEFMIEITKPNSDPLEIEKLLKKQGASRNCYAMSWNDKIDGKHMSLSSALEVAVGEGFPSIISCIPGRLAYFEAEQEYGPPPRFILNRPF
ncbi:hypothetical protein FIU87_10310 [Bacillus sp. THAF10]|uniref:hypothetical protein n=1 Tax=Bacillus sp. THAF10 TaxID=2587848 RepID=UPI0012689598|nr:hypothetical protein [Bacillus sp. THAF10]QFT89039.1 hypothetical protein FIU87_10310 [Bacillus sp. THAF10]